MAEVVETVIAMPCRGMGITASVMSKVRAPCSGSLAPRWGLGRGGVGARAQEGSCEVELAPEAKGSGESELALDAKGSGEAEPALVILGVLLLFSFFVFFISLIWVSLFMVPNTMADAQQARPDPRGEATGSRGREADPMIEAGSAPPASNGGSGSWMGSVGPWMGLAGLSMCFLFFLYFSTRLTKAGKQPTRKRSYLL